MKNFQVKHGQCDNVIFPQDIFFKSSKQLLDLCLWILYFWQVLESIHKFIIELYVQQCLFVRGSNKKQRSGRLISQKEKLFYLLREPNALGGNLTMRSTSLHLPRKAFLSPLVWPRREYTSMLNWTENLPDCFLFPQT